MIYVLTIALEPGLDVVASIAKTREHMKRRDRRRSRLFAASEADLQLQRC